MASLLFATVLGLAIGALIGGVLLRAAIALANKVFKPERLTSDTQRPLEANLGNRYESQPNFDSLGDQQLNDTPVSSNPYAGPSNQNSSNTPSDSNPYTAPINYGTPAKAARRNTKLAIPEPAYSHACGITLVQGLVSSLINFVVLGVAPMEIGPILSIGTGFVVAVFVYGLMLPTTAGKAVVIYLFQILIVIAIMLVLGVGIAGFTAILG